MEIVFTLDDQPHPERQTIKRSRLGCFNCRRRKKKCDEQRPTCSACDQKCIRCVWPVTCDERLPPGYQLPPVDAEKARARKLAQAFVSVEFSPDNNQIKRIRKHPPGQQPLVEVYESKHVFESEPEPQPPQELQPEDPYLELSLELSTSHLAPLHSLSSVSSQTFLSACVDAFIKGFSPQVTHPLLTPLVNFTPYINQNDIMRKVSLACGLTHILWERPEYSKLAYVKFRDAFDSLYNHISTFSSDKQRINQNWLCVASQLLCRCSRRIPNFTNNELRSCIQSLNISYQIIKLRFGSQIFESMTSMKAIQLTGNLQMEIENSLLSSSSSNFSFNHHFNKVYLDSFLYNYSITLFISRGAKYLPDPFEVFKNLHHLMKTPLFPCDVVWMNNPVFGASLDSFEILAKASYLSKLDFQNSSKVHQMAKKLYNYCCFYPVYVVPFQIRAKDLNKYERLRDSVFISETVLKSAKIMLRKMLIPDIDETDTMIQEDLQIIVKRFKKMDKFSKAKSIAALPILIGGAVSITQEDRDLFIENCEVIGELTHSRHSYTIIDVLHASWRKTESFSDSSSKGINILFNDTMLSTISD